MDTITTDPLYFAAGLIALRDESQHLIGTLRAISQFPSLRRVLVVLDLFQKAITLTIETLPRGSQGLKNDWFRENHIRTIKLCLQDCSPLMRQLDEYLIKVGGNSLRNFLLDTSAAEILRTLEFWSKSLTETLTEWNTFGRLHQNIEMILEHQVVTVRMVEHMMSRSSQDPHGTGDLPSEEGTGAMQGDITPNTRNYPQDFPKVPDMTTTNDTTISTPYSARLVHRLEQASERLREISMLETERPFLFPFVIVPDDPQAPTSTPFRVKLDSGCELNWISMRILKRSGLEDKLEGTRSDRAWLGFGGGEELIVPEGTITLTWYSVNAAYTHRHEFLVHDQVPFDVVLGSRFIIEEGWKKSFNDPVLALRYSELSDEQLSEIHQKARQNKEATDAQRQTEREMRARDRQTRRGLGLSRTGTPRSFLSPAGSRALSRKMSMTTVTGNSSLAGSPLSAQPSRYATSEDPSISESPRSFSTITTQQDVVSSDVGESAVVPSVPTETGTGQDPVSEV